MVGGVHSAFRSPQSAIDMIEDKELAKLFKAESAEHLARLDDGLLRLEKTPTDQALLEEVFRESHSLKGAARMLGLTRIESSAHELESIFNAARKGETALTPQSIEHMNAALGNLRQRVNEINADQTNTECGVRNAEPEIPQSELRTPQSELRTPQSEFRNPQSEFRNPQSEFHNPQSEFRNPQSEFHNPQSEFHIETVRVETRKLDELLTQVGELSVIQGRAHHRMALMEELLELWSALERTRRIRNAQHGEGESATRFGSLLKQARNALFDDCARMDSTVNRLEDQVHNIRLLPLSTVFALFPRMVRDLAKGQGKEAELVLEGGDITVDKRILEEMKDPLMHLLRNAIDHGIESPAERERMGKPRNGTVWLRALRENASVLLEVRDDGSGLDNAAIRLTAKKRGILNAEFGMHPQGVGRAVPVAEATSAMLQTADSMPQSNTPQSSIRNPQSDTAQLQQLIFMPGFSTSSYVTELSGRGVGLDVVRVNVERMKGSIRLESSIGQGLTIQLRLPLSLATTRLLLASANGQLYGLPVEFVHTSRRVRVADVFTLEGRLAVLLDGKPVIAAHLADLLELSASKRAASSDIMACVVLQIGDEQLGLLVDELLSEEEVVPKPPGAPLRRVRNVSALAMLGSGDICAVLNPSDLLRTCRMRNTECGAQNETNAPHSAIDTTHSILLVEDSALIRAMEKRILEDNGYEVVTAVDGVDGLNLLGSRAFAAVVSDIMMPNMTGLELTLHIRAEPRYKELPIILVTTLASDEDKRRGLDAGANAYIPKPSFDQRVLLDTLQRLI